MELRSYVVCSSPRSGSTLLCDLLRSTGVAGRPEEYFEARRATGVPPHPGDYLHGLERTGAGIRDNERPPDSPPYSDLRGLTSYRDHLRRTFVFGTTANGVFGAKLMWRQLPELQALAHTLPEYAGLDGLELIDRLLEHPAYIWMRRRDKVRQAISLWRALQTRRWRQDHQGAAPAPAELLYSFAAIRHLAQMLQDEDAGWGDLFARRGIDALIIDYEHDLEPDPRAAVLRVLDRIGVQTPVGWSPATPMQRQADALSEQWLAAYHQDLERLHGRQTA
jgi:LPS sulfotransferase NodH